MEDPLENWHKIGNYSGNQRVDPHTLEERDIEDENSQQLWFDEIVTDPDFSEDMKNQVSVWQNKIATNEDPAKINVHIVGQSHIDMAWLWRYEQTRRKGIKTYRKAVYHSQRFPDSYRFAASEPSLLAWIKEDDPELFEQIKTWQQNGNIELVGGSWVEPDCNIPSGEAFIRQRLYGMRFYRDEFNSLPVVEWFLDSFGYNVGLPQILIKSGAKYFWSNKMTWNLITKFPFVNFIWESPDGSQLVSTNFGQNQDAFNQWEKYEAGRHLIKSGGKQRWSYWDDYNQFEKEIDPEKYVSAVGYFVGRGDGGHGPTHQEVAELNGQVEASKSVGLNLNWSTVQKFYEEIASFREDLPIWADELALENHQGTLSGQSEVKRHNRRLEYLLQAVESLEALLGAKDSSFEFLYEELEHVWKIVLLNQFHDVLPGSSIPEVYDDIYLAWEECDNLLNTILDRALNQINAPEEFPIILYNPLSWSRKSPVFIPLELCTEPIELDENGKPPYARLMIEKGDDFERYTCQPVAAEPIDRMKNRPAGWWTIIEIPAYGILNAKIVFEPVQGASLHVQVGTVPRITNDLVSIDFDGKTGAMLQIKVVGINHGENLVYGRLNNLIIGYKDDSRSFPTWNLTPEYWKYPLNYIQDRNVDIFIMDQGPILVTLGIRRNLGGTPILQTIRLFKDDPRIYCMWSADWQEPHVLLKVGLDTTTNATIVTADQMYCALKRSSIPKTPADKARFEKTMHDYADLSTPTNDWGIALFNEGKYAFDASADRIRMTLHRSPNYPGPAGESWANFERAERLAQDGSKPPEFVGLGPVSCRYAYFPHQNGTLFDIRDNPFNGVKRASQEFNVPILVRAHTATGPIPYDFSEFQLPENVQLAALKRNEWDKSSAIILRITEICGQKETSVTMTIPTWLAEKVSNIQPVDLLERPIEGSIEWEPSQAQAKFVIHAFEIVSLELVF